MTTDEDRHALERFVAGLPVDADALATAITARAFDETIVDEALLKGLTNAEPAVRRRTARRVTRMVDVGTRVAARLAIVAETDPDPGARLAAEEALHAHGRRALTLEPVPRTSFLASLRFKLAPVRSGGDVSFAPLEPDPGLDTDARLLVVDGVVHLELRDLPSAFAGTRPAILVKRDGDVVELVRAQTPVSAAGSAAIALPAEAGALDVVKALLQTFDVVIPAA